MNIGSLKMSAGQLCKQGLNKYHLTNTIMSRGAPVGRAIRPVAEAERINCGTLRNKPPNLNSESTELFLNSRMK